MNGIWILLLLIISAALPVIVVFFWFRARKSPVTLPWFLVSLTAGIISLLAATIIQNLVPSLTGNRGSGPGAVFFKVFIRVAMVEEASRLITLIPLFKAGSRRRKMDRTFCGALGLVAGLGFAALESAFYGIADVNMTLIRAFTAALIHGACGIRVSMAFFYVKQHPMKALLFFFFAVLIHGAYNLIIVSPALPSWLAALVAVTALSSPLLFFKAADSADENLITKTPGNDNASSS